MNAVLNKNDGVLLQVRVVPNARKTASDGLLGDRIKIRVQAPPVDGKANKALTAFLAKQLHLKKSQITVLSGSSSRNKTLFISGVSSSDIESSSLLP